MAIPILALLLEELVGASAGRFLGTVPAVEAAAVAAPLAVQPEERRLAHIALSAAEAVPEAAAEEQCNGN